MSDQQMANRLHDILSTKASMGMGYGGRGRRMRRSYSEDMESPFGRGVYAGVGTEEGASGNSWIHYLQDYSERYGYKYNELLKNPKLLDKVRKSYCKFSKTHKFKTNACKPKPVSRKKVSRTSSKRKVSRTVSKKKVSRSVSKSKSKVKPSSKSKKLVYRKECKPGMMLKEIKPKKKGSKRQPYLRCVKRK